MSTAVYDRQTVTGIVVNDHPNLPRREYDTLKAVLHDAARRGPVSANRDNIADFRSHPLGRIAWARTLNPARAAKLQRQFDRISWSQP